MDKWDGQSLTRQIDNVLAYLGYGPDDSDDMEAAVVAVGHLVPDSHHGG